jgi:CDP-6-deoxy-D-xylo-4-hexulose-3-dehydrase
VIAVACAFPTTVAPIVQYGAVPVFVDVLADSANVDVTQLETARTEKTKAVFLAHTLGNPFDVHAVKAFCERHALWLIEDNCDALGSRVDGQLTGTFGDIGTSSFYPPHHLTMGEGGAVYTNDPLLRKIMLSIRDWGRDCWCDSGIDNTCGCRFSGQFGTLPQGYDHKYVYSHFGYNLKATDLQAAIGCAQLDKLAGFTEQRKQNFAFLRESLSGVAWLHVQCALPNAEPSWFGFLMTLAPDAPVTRNQLAERLEQRRIQTRNLFAGNLTRHPCFAALQEGTDYRVATPLVNTDKIMNDSLWVGVYPGMTPEKLEYIADTIKEVGVYADGSQ